MPNTFFQLKQFTIHQDRCAMKVCTDSCLFGAWVADVIKKNQLKIKSALDIGTGTGLLSLMLAQENDFDIEALEINTDAASQAKENIENTPWKNRVNVFNQSLQEFTPQKKYDFIFSNPPFFENDLTSSSEAKNSAKHDSTLTLEYLIDFIKLNLDHEGCAAALLPFHRTDYFEMLLEVKDLYLLEKILVRQSPSHDYFRSMLFVSYKKHINTVIDEISIRDEIGNYSAGFADLLKPYYLKL